MQKAQIQNLISQALKAEFGLERLAELIHLEHPQDETHGDWASNVAMSLGKELGQSPREIAQKLVTSLQGSAAQFESIEIAGPGFINFKLKPSEYISGLQAVGQHVGKYGADESMAGRKVMIEFTDPNPFKEMHIGHFYSNAVGESIARILEFNGAEVQRVNYQGDVGLHVAKAIWGIRKKMASDNITLDDLEKLDLAARTKFMGQAYALGAQAYDETGAQDEIKEINKQIFAQDPLVMEIWQKGRQWSLDEFENVYKRLGTKFDDYFFESEAAAPGKAIVEDALQKGVFEKSQGAVIFPGEKYGLHSRVFINSQGLPTYEAKELGLAPTKYARYEYDFSIIVTANEIDEYFKVLLAAMQQVRPDLAQKTKHLSHGMVRLTTGKMSSRTGKVITAQDLLDQIQEMIGAQAHSADLPEAELDKIAVAAVKYAWLKSKLGGDIEFNPSEAASLEGNSGPYLQYVYVRCQSILNDAKEVPWQADVLSVQAEAEELALARMLSRFPESVAAAAEQYAPHLICNYLFELGQRFNTFYGKYTVLKSEGDTKALRLQLTAASAQVIKNGLHLLGIAVVEKM